MSRREKDTKVFEEAPGPQRIHTDIGPEASGRDVLATRKANWKVELSTAFWGQHLVPMITFQMPFQCERVWNPWSPAEGTLRPKEVK